MLRTSKPDYKGAQTIKTIYRTKIKLNKLSLEQVLLMIEETNKYAGEDCIDIKKKIVNIKNVKDLYYQNFHFLS